MTMRITMRQTRMGESGSLLDSGSTYTVSDAFGAAMVGATYATDTDGVLSSPKATGLQDMKYNPLTQSAVSGDGTQLLDLGPVTAIGYNANGSVASVTTPSGVTSIAYDLAGKPTTVTSPSGVQTIAYNGNGTVASIS
jgi:YD repeat-containing protein